ncbi:MAG: hypothetical protein GXO75_07070 [Calditrichaeota bacterium]|nr:hypothetical protein [Calditrichota bacterium]
MRKWKLIIGGVGFPVSIGVVFLGILLPLSIKVVGLWHIVVKKHLLCRRINLGIFSSAAIIIIYNGKYQPA